MCGRYATARNPDDLVEEFGIERLAMGDVGDGLPPNYNVAPTDDVYAVLERLDKEHRSNPPQRQLRVVRWGLVPSWAKDPKIGNRLINARVETLADKPAFRKAFAVRRCLLPADGYYEWYAGDDERAAPGDAPRVVDSPKTGPKNAKTPKNARKQPFFIRKRGGGILPIAGLYEFWRDPNAETDDDPWLWSCTLITTDAVDELGRIHDRMPMLVEPANWDRWLDPRVDDPDQLRRLLVPATPGRLEAYPVSTLVNDVRNNGPELIAPIEGVALPAS